MTRTRLLCQVEMRPGLGLGEFSEDLVHPCMLDESYSIEAVQACRYLHLRARARLMLRVRTKVKVEVNLHLRARARLMLRVRTKVKVEVRKLRLGSLSPPAK